MAKKIDIVDVKQAVKDGQIEVKILHARYAKKTVIYLKDTQSGESIFLGEMKDESDD